MSEDTSRFVARHIQSLPRSGIREFFSIVSKMPEAISLGIGEPDFHTPWRIREAAIFALERGKTSYTDNLGLIQLRRAISTYVEEHFGLSYHPENEIVVTTGVSEGLDAALRAIIDPGDKVLYHEPCYVAYLPCVQLAHGEGVPIPTSAEDNFSLNPKKLAEAWQPGCKALVLNFPTNPTGGVLDPESMQGIGRFAVEKDLLVITDEIYAELTYGEKHRSIAALPGMKERTLFLHGVSKAFAMTGFRIGFACGPAALIEAVTKVHQYGMLCAPIVSQEAALEALRHGEEAVAGMRAQYLRRRDYVVRRFNELGLPCHLPKGTFYAFPDIRSSGLTDDQFCRRLLEEQKVAVVPGTAFGPSGHGFVRASFATAYERLIEALNRIEKFLENLKSSNE